MSEVRFDSSTAPQHSLRRLSPYWGLHVARYQFARPLVGNALVLDIACGTGYGLAILRTQARSVVGVDLDLDAVRKARSSSAGSEFVAGDGCVLPFVADSFDAITSFETLEHLENRNQFLSELRRVLKPDGVCIISTPNANYTRPKNGKPRNPHHVFEYTPPELAQELHKHFAEVEMLGQTLDTRFVMSPFLEDQERLPRTPVMMGRIALWRIIHKMPVGVRDSLCQAIWGHPMFPGDDDFHFDSSTVTDAPVLLALCRGRLNASTK